MQYRTVKALNAAVDKMQVPAPEGFRLIVLGSSNQALSSLQLNPIL